MATKALGGYDGLAERRQAHDADLRIAMDFDADERAEQRHTAGVRERAVDGIDDPAPPGRAGLHAELLADDAVVRIGRLDAQTYELLGLAIRDGDDRAVLFAL